MTGLLQASVMAAAHGGSPPTTIQGRAAATQSLLGRHQVGDPRGGF
jgi:hypothetical protein